MPIYEYQCQNCKTNFEAFVSSFAKAGDVKCAKCGSKKVKKALSATCRLSGSTSSSSSNMSGCAPGSGFS